MDLDKKKEHALDDGDRPTAPGAPALTGAAPPRPDRPEQSLERRRHAGAPGRRQLPTPEHQNELGVAVPHLKGQDRHDERFRLLEEQE